MAIVYRNAGAWGAGKGSQLTPTEADGNFHDINSRVDALETSPKIAKVITSVSGDQNTLTINFSDATTQDLEMPVEHWSWRGEMQPSTQYYKGDVVYWPFPNTEQRVAEFGQRGLYLATQDILTRNQFFYDDDLTADNNGDGIPNFVLIYDMWQSPSGKTVGTYGFGTYVGNDGEHAPVHGGVESIGDNPGYYYYPVEDQAGYYFRADTTTNFAGPYCWFWFYGDVGTVLPIGCTFYFRNLLDFSGSVSGAVAGETMRFSPDFGSNPNFQGINTIVELETPLGIFNAGNNNGSYIWTDSYGALVTARKVASYKWELSIDNGSFGGIVIDEV